MSTMFAILVLCGLLLHYSHQGMHKDFGGAYDLDLIHCYLCKDEDQGSKKIIFMDVKTRKLNRTIAAHNVSINFTTKLDDENDFHFKVAKWGNGGWIPNFFDMRLKKPFTVIEKASPGMIKPFYEGAGIEKPPFMPGVYKLLSDYVFQPHDLSLPALPYNKYQGKLLIIEKDDQVMGCVMFDFDIKPRQKNKG